MDLLEGAIQPYDWGSTSAIAAIQGREPTGEPEAELWIGAHPIAPSVLWRDGKRHLLNELVAADPDAELGLDVAARWRGQLPFLLKILAAAAPLSLQAHPSLARAKLGFAEENATGIPIDAPNRLFRDANHKPELICAVTPFTALCGFREVPRSLELLGALGGGDLGQVLLEKLSAAPNSEGLRDCMVTALGTPRDAARQPLSAVRDSASSGIEGFESEAQWLVRLVDKMPDDPAVFVAALLDLVVLAPGEALFLAAGNLHSYLDGVGVELMANSDNVLRGGMTSKHVDIEALAEVVTTDPAPAPVQRPKASVWTYDSPVGEFALTRIVLDNATEALPRGPAAVLSVAGSAVVNDGGTDTTIVSGQAGWLRHGNEPGTISGSGIVFVATEGSDRF